MSDHTHGTMPPEALALRARAVEQLMIEKGLLRDGAVDKIVEIFEHELGPRNGAKIVARAWSDPEFLARLRADTPATLQEYGFSGMEGSHMVLCENTPEVHNVIVCTLCSCYPWPLLGLPPMWYKTAAYRSRIVIEPRAVLAEFSTEIPKNVELRVWDSNAELRYFVLPMRPAGTEGWSAEQLEKLVTRNSMIGTGLPLAPQDLEGEAA